jgi:hypothetical protein
MTPSSRAMIRCSIMLSARSKVAIGTSKRRNSKTYPAAQNRYHSSQFETWAYRDTLRARTAEATISMTAARPASFAAQPTCGD